MTSLIKENYSHIRKMADRSKMSTQEALKIRKHHLNSCEMECVKNAWGQGVGVIPYRKGIRSCFLGALFELGMDVPHDTKSVAERFIDVAAVTELKKGNVLDSYLKRRVLEKGSANMIDIARELQRISGMHPYGLKLTQIGMSIDIVSMSPMTCSNLNNPAFIRLSSHQTGAMVSPRNDFVSPYKKNDFSAFVEASPSSKTMSRWTTIRELVNCNCSDNEDN